MKKVVTVLFAGVMVLGMAMAIPEQAVAQGAAGYAGEATCLGCHTGRDADLVAEYLKSGHRYKLNPVTDGVPRAYPDGRLYHPLNGDAPFAPAEVTPPAGTSWSDFAYVIGGYGWKARFVRTNGRIYTLDAEAQQNLYSGNRVTYHLGENKKYDYGCFQCHTTGATPDGSWNGVPGDALGTFTDPGVTCEGCHGPSADHANGGAFQNPPILPPNTGEFLEVTRCIECHQRGGATNAIPASGGFIRHHEQGNEFRASAHGDGVGDDLTCISCHNQHVALHYPELAGVGENGISTTCENCHGPGGTAVEVNPVLVNNVAKSINCVDCHMPKASKSSEIRSLSAYGYEGDVKTHIMAINTNPVTRNEAMFAPDGSGPVALDGNGHAAVTMDFACLACHTNKDIGWAASYATVMHSIGGVQTASEDLADVPKEFTLEQNYPNPFNPRTTIRFDLPATAEVTLDIFSVDGRLVESMLNRTMPAGDHKVEINADFLPSGNYIYRLKAGSFTQTKTMTLLK